MHFIMFPCGIDFSLNIEQLLSHYNTILKILYFDEERYF